jgi:hypothetical protein
MQAPQIIIRKEPNEDHPDCIIPSDDKEFYVLHSKGEVVPVLN